MCTVPSGTSLVTRLILELGIYTKSNEILSPKPPQGTYNGDFSRHNGSRVIGVCLSFRPGGGSEAPGSSPGAVANPPPLPSFPQRIQVPRVKTHWGFS